MENLIPSLCFLPKSSSNTTSSRFLSVKPLFHHQMIILCLYSQVCERSMIFITISKTIPQEAVIALQLGF
jgi:hypothetical protein